MNGTVHTIIGLTTGTAIVLTQADKLPFLSNNALAPSAFIFATTLGSIVPDFDRPGGPLGFLGHRKFTHTLTVPVLCIILAYLIPNLNVLIPVKAYLFGFAFAWVMHIVADLFQRKGAPLFWPFLPMKMHVHIASMPVKYDKVFLFFYCIAICVILYMIGIDKIQEKLLSSSPSILLSIGVALYFIKKYFGKAAKEVRRG